MDTSFIREPPAAVVEMLRLWRPSARRSRSLRTAVRTAFLAVAQRVAEPASDRIGHVTVAQLCRVDLSPPTTFVGVALALR